MTNKENIFPFEPTVPDKDKIVLPFNPGQKSGEEAGDERVVPKKEEESGEEPRMDWEKKGS